MNIDHRGSPLIVGIGEVLWDELPDGSRQFGGAPANFACQCAQLGARAVLVSSIGQDQPGVQAREELLRRGVDASYLHVDSHPTGAVNVEVDSAGQAEYEIAMDAAWDYIPWTDPVAELAANCDAVCFGTLAQREPQSFRTIKHFLKATKDDCLKVFDVNLRQYYYSRILVEESLKQANVLKLNDFELATISGFYDIKSDGLDAAKRIQELFELDVVVLTLGAKGSAILKGEETSFVEARPTEIVDTVGAGDSFTAATVMGLLNDKTLEQINRFASRLAAFVCQHPGANPLIPDACFAKDA